MKDRVKHVVTYDSKDHLTRKNFGEDKVAAEVWAARNSHRNTCVTQERGK